MNLKNKKQTAVKGRSSALIVTIVVHVVFFLVAGTYVAMEVIERQETKFEGKQIVRPKMKLKKLQVPVNIKKKATNKPKLRKRIVVQPKMNSTMPDIKMPEITGVKGGLGGGIAGGLGGAGGVERDLT